MHLLELKDLVKSYARRVVVDHVNLHVDAGEVVGLLGPNGAGKTTSFKMAVGMVRPERGKVLLGGKDVTRMPMFKRARRGLGYLSQEPSIFRGMTVKQNIEAVLELTFRGSRSARKARLAELLAELDLTRLSNSISARLSGGEKRRLEITRALAVQPQVLLLDEPFSGIDPIAVNEIQDIVVKLRESHNLGILLTDHNVRETLTITDRTYVIHEGKVFREGTASELVEDPEVRKHYLGERFEMSVRDGAPPAAPPAAAQAAPSVLTPPPVAPAGPAPDTAPAPSAAVPVAPAAPAAEPAPEAAVPAPAAEPAAPLDVQPASEADERTPQPGE